MIASQGELRLLASVLRSGVWEQVSLETRVRPGEKGTGSRDYRIAFTVGQALCCEHVDVEWLGPSAQPTAGRISKGALAAEFRASP